MHRLLTQFIPHARRILTLVSCAAVLLTSFQDEVLLASTSSASERDEAGALPPDDQHGAAFPDLSRSDKDERLGCVVAHTSFTTRFVPQQLRQVSRVPHLGLSHSGRSLATLLCVWRI